MKYPALLTAVFLLVIGCVTIANLAAEEQRENPANPEDQAESIRAPETQTTDITAPEEKDAAVTATEDPVTSGRTAESPGGQENMNIKLIGPPSPMAAPSENAEAMEAYRIGTILMEEGKLDEAEGHLLKAIGLDPLFVDAMDHLGMVYRRQNRLTEAEEMYLRSIGINAENRVPYQNLAVVYKLQGRPNAALELYIKMIDLDEDDPEPYYGIGDLLYEAGNFELSNRFFDQAIARYIKRGSDLVYDAIYYKGLNYYYLGRYDEALQCLEEVQKVNPSNKTVNRIIDEIRNKKI